MFFPQSKHHHKSAFESLRFNTNAADTHRYSRFPLLITILFLHLFVIVIWQSTPRSASPAQPSRQVFFLIFTATIKPPPQIKSAILNRDTRITKVARAKTVNPQVASTKIQPSDLPVINEQIKITDNTPDSSLAPIPLQKNIRELTMSLKEDFSKQEKNFRPDNYSQQASIRKFSNAIADAAKIPREGVIIEKKFAYDGRPVSKIKTPYRTYCVRHPKAGEKLELSPPPLPVTCGEL